MRKRVNFGVNPKYHRTQTSGENPAGPSAKPKYSSMTDSEQVPWGKGEKNPVEGSEIEPKTACLQTVGA